MSQLQQATDKLSDAIKRFGGFRFANVVKDNSSVSAASQQGSPPILRKMATTAKILASPAPQATDAITKLLGPGLLSSVLSLTGTYTNFYTQMAEIGAAPAGGLIELASNIAATGLSAEHYVNLTAKFSLSDKLLRSSSDSLASFVSRTAKANLRSGLFGMSIEDFADIAAEYTEDFRRYGISMKKLDDMFVGDLARQVTGLSAATGTERKEILRRVNSALKDNVAFNAQMRLANDPSKAKAARKAVTAFAAMNGEAGETLSKLVADRYATGEALRATSELYQLFDRTGFGQVNREVESYMKLMEGNASIAEQAEAFANLTNNLSELYTSRAQIIVNNSDSEDIRKVASVLGRVQPVSAQAARAAMENAELKDKFTALSLTFTFMWNKFMGIFKTTLLEKLSHVSTFMSRAFSALDIKTDGTSFLGSLLNTFSGISSGENITPQQFIDRFFSPEIRKKILTFIDDFVNNRPEGFQVSFGSFFVTLQNVLKGAVDFLTTFAECIARIVSYADDVLAAGLAMGAYIATLQAIEAGKKASNILDFAPVGLPVTIAVATAYSIYMIGEENKKYFEGVAPGEQHDAGRKRRRSYNEALREQTNAVRRQAEGSASPSNEATGSDSTSKPDPQKPPTQRAAVLTPPAPIKPKLEGIRSVIPDESEAVRISAEIMRLQIAFDERGNAFATKLREVIKLFEERQKSASDYNAALGT